ncbi:unnamed protein product [Amoebophrya sp. A25]|nr:unnamed protein product [Amoebophrya sp. A25]|eukprot:GSA25T00015831001.1
MRRSLLVTSGATALAAENSGIKKVISLLSDMKSKVETEIKDGDVEAEEFENWCIKSITEGEADVKYGGEKVEELKATVENEAAKASGFANEVSTLAPEIAKLQANQAAAKEERKEAHSTFQKEEAELVEADTMLQKAYSVLKRSLSFLQSGGSNSKAVDDAKNAVTALATIIESIGADADSQAKIKAFLEESDPSEQLNLLQQPQAATSNYQSKSGGILDAIQGMQEKNAQVLAELRDKDLKARHEFELLMQDLKNQEASKTEQLEAAKENAAKAEAAGKTAGGDLASAEDVLKSDSEELGNTKAECDTKAKAWAARKEEATMEAGALSQAIEILSGKFGGESFLQVHASVLDRRAKASLLLRKLGNEYNQFSLIQAANSAQADPFVKVRGMIKDMITKLEDEAAKEASKEAKCKADKEKGEKDLKLKKGDNAKISSRVDAAEAKFAKLGTEISDLNTQLNELAADVKERTALRNKEKSENEAVIKDAAESVEALNGAITVLQDFYGKATSFLQQPQSDAANTIISVLQTAQEDFEKLKQETEAAESDAADKYEKFSQEAKVAQATKTASVKGKTQEKAGVQESIGMLSEDLAEAGKALQAATDFLKGVMESCANKAMSYEERKKRREAEVAGLKDALEILSSDEESFLQVASKKFLARK